MGNDIDGTDHGYKLHLIYGALAAPSEKAYATINDSPEAIAFSWEITTTPVQVTDLKPTALLTIDSTKVDADALAGARGHPLRVGGSRCPSAAPRRGHRAVRGHEPPRSRLTGANAPTYDRGHARRHPPDRHRCARGRSTAPRPLRALSLR